MIGDKFQVLIHGPAFIDAQVEDKADGTYVVTYLPQVKGIYDVFVGLGGIQISGSPFTSIIGAGNKFCSQNIEVHSRRD